MQAAQRALVVTREKAANEAKSEFMSLMCHEVRTPLNGCLASAEMLLDTPLLDEQRELTNTIRISGSILLSTVSNFLDFFKVQAGKKLDIVRSPFFLSDLITDVHCIVEAMMGPDSKVRCPQYCARSLPADADVAQQTGARWYIRLCDAADFAIWFRGGADEVCIGVLSSDPSVVKRWADADAVHQRLTWCPGWPSVWTAV